MSANNPQQMLAMLNGLVQPWNDAIAQPAQAQQQVLTRFLQIYSQTDYGKQHNAAQIQTIDDYRREFPVTDRTIRYKPLIQRVMAGEINLLLNEPPIGWAITRGTTKGESKFIPMTPTDLKMRVSASRAMVNYVLQIQTFRFVPGRQSQLEFSVGRRQSKDGRARGRVQDTVRGFIPSSCRRRRRFAPCQRKKKSMRSAAARRSAIGTRALNWRTGNAKTKT